MSCRQIALSNDSKMEKKIKNESFSFLHGFASMSLLFVLFRNKIAAHKFSCLLDSHLTLRMVDIVVGKSHCEQHVCNVHSQSVSV